MKGEYDGYWRLFKGLVHKRTEDWRSDNLVIIFSLRNSMNKYHKFSLHWQLNVQRLTFKRQNHVFFVYCETEGNIYHLYFGVQIGGKIASTDLDIQRGFDDGNNIEG